MHLVDHLRNRSRARGERRKTERTSDTDVLLDLRLSDRHVEVLERLAASINPDMPPAIGMAHAVRRLLESLEESGFTIDDAEEGVTTLAEAHLSRDSAKPQRA
jgi:hypothetical protein